MKSESTVTPGWEAAEFSDIIYGSVYPVRLIIPENQNEIAGFISRSHEDSKLELIIPIQTDEAQEKSRPFIKKAYQFAQKNRQTLNLTGQIVEFEKAKTGLRISNRDDAISKGLEVSYVRFNKNMFMHISLYEDFPHSNFNARSLGNFTGELLRIMGWSVTPITLATNSD